jgi:hypothetical protein
MAEYAAAIDRVHFHCFSDGGEPEGWPGKKVAHNRLQVTIGETKAGLKRREPLRKGGGPVV